MKIKSLSCPNCGTALPPSLRPEKQFDCPACHSLLVLTDLVSDSQIICGSCHSVNDDSKRFCQDCGDPLMRGCPYCHIENAVDVAHCRNCGVNLQQAQTRRQSWVMEARQRRSERQEAHQQAIANELQQFIDDLDEPENHPMAIFGLQMLGDEAVEGLIAHLNDDDPDARYGAAQALGRIGDKRAVQPLIDSLSDAEPAVRYWAIDSLSKLQANDSVSAIGKLIDDEHEGVKAHALNALKQIGTSEAECFLEEKTKRRWWPF